MNNMQRVGRRPFRKTILIMAALAALILPNPSRAQSTGSQNIDPFYWKLFKDGETAFLAKDYPKAVQDLEIAIFGLTPDKKISLKAHIYLGLGYSVLIDREKTLEHLAQAFQGLGTDDPASLELEDWVVSSYKKAIQQYKIISGPSGKPAEGPAWKTSPVTGTSGKPVEGPVWKTSPAPEPKVPVPPRPAVKGDPKDLEAQIKADPDNRDLRIALAELQLQEGQAGKAEKALEDFVGRNKEAFRAVYHLARTRYFLGRHRKALEGFHAAISPAGDAQLTREESLKASIYIALCLHRLGQESSLISFRDKVLNSVSASDLKRMLTEERLEKTWKDFLARTSPAP